MAANAAYSTIRQALKNGAEVTSVLDKVGTVIGAEERLTKEINRKKNSPITALLGKDYNDFEEFAALEKLRARRREMEQYLKLYCPAGTYQRWQDFQSEARKARRQAEKDREARIKELKETAVLVTVVLLGIAALGGYGYYAWSLR